MAALTGHPFTISSSSGLEDVRRFAVKYAGLVPEIRCDIDPSGRTDLLKILDQAETAGQITILGSRADFEEDAWLDINCDALTVRTMLPDALKTSEVGDASLELVIPLHMLASVGFVQEEALNIVPLKIGDVASGSDSAIYHLGLLYTRTPQIAEKICQHLAQCFQFVYRESMTTLDCADHNTQQDDIFGTIQSAACSTPSSCSPTEEPIKQVCLSQTSTPTTQSSKNTVELINDYLTMLSACLTHEELHKFAVLMKRWRAKEMPILEFAQKLLELYGVERKHLLARMKSLLRGVSREELDALSNFLCANGVTENAAESSNSPFWTADMSLSTDESGSPLVDNISGCSGNWSSSAFRNGEAGFQNSQPESRPTSRNLSKTT